MQLFARLQKENPKAPQYHFAWIALSEMQASRMPKDDKMAASLKMLAYRSLKAAADNTIAKKDAPRQITSAKELRLVAQIYRQQNYDDDLLVVLDSPQIGIESEVGKNDVEFIRVKMEILSQKQKWKDLREFCFSSLDKLCIYREDSTKSIEETPGNIAWADDWHVWKAMIKASSHLSNSEFV
jgi:N-terminal acetyltransferase B complex non-catalytic subunit